MPIHERTSPVTAEDAMSNLAAAFGEGIYEVSDTSDGIVIDEADLCLRRPSAGAVAEVPPSFPGI